MLKQHKLLIPGIILGVIMIAAGLGYLLSLPQGDELPASIAVKLAVEPDEQGAAPPNSIFSISSQYRVSEQQLRAMLDIDPPMNFTLTGGGKRWELRPTMPLAPNSIYTIRIKNSEGAPIWSFAFQTRTDLMIGATYPTDEQSYVSIHNGIEIKFNASDVDLSNYFEIKPAISGRFESNGYTSLFIPSQPLMPDSVYRVTVKAGARAAGGLTLQKDYSFSFETEADPLTQKELWRQLRLSGSFSETFLPGDTLAVEMEGGDNNISGQTFDLALYRFPDLGAYAGELRAYENFYLERFGAKRDYYVSADKLEKVMESSGELYQNSYRWYAVLPDNLPAGHYLFTLSGKDSEGNPQYVQKLLQLTNVSLYTQSSDGDTLFWLNDPVTGDPLRDVSLTVEDRATGSVTTAQTLADGSARLMLPESKAVYLTVGRNGVPVYFGRELLSAQEKHPLSNQYFGGMYTDREIYQPDDVIRVWGVIRPRGVGAKLPETAYLSLGVGWETADLSRQKVKINADGTFTGEIPVSGIRRNWYSVRLCNEAGESYLSKSISIDRYTKPAYLIDVSTDKEYYYFDEKVQFTVSADYFDGTPAAGKKLRFFCADVQLPDGGKEITLDDEGKAVFTLQLDPHLNTDKGMLRSWEPQSSFYQARSDDEQEVNVYEGGYLTILPSRLAAQLNLDENDRTRASFSLAQLDASKIKTQETTPWTDNFDRLAGAPADQPVSLVVNRVEYQQIPDGQYYDYINKKTIQRYKTQRVETIDRVIPVTTSGGKAQISGLPVSDDPFIYYWVEARFHGNVYGDVNVTSARLMPRMAMGMDSMRYSLLSDDVYNPKLKLGESLPLALYENGRKTENKGRIFYSLVQNKMLTTDIMTEDSRALTMSAEMVPNFTLTGAYFDGRHVYALDQRQVTYDFSEKTLQVALSTDKESYRPGDTAKVTLKVTGADGKPTAAQACIGVVDEAVFAVMEQEVNFAAQLYAPMYYSYIEQNASYREYALEKANADSGGMGGGGGSDENIRSDFVDTASFTPISVDSSGTATVEIKLPDNITSWRITAAAVTSDLQGGDGKSNTIASLPFYLQPIITPAFLSGDDVVFSAQSGGTQELTQETTVDYIAVITDENGAEIDRLTASGAPGERTVFNFGKYEEGGYRITISGRAGEYNDAVEKPFTVRDQSVILPVIQTMPVSEIAGLRSADYPVLVHLYDEALAPCMETLAHLSALDGERAEAAVAAYRAQVLYRAWMPDGRDYPIYKSDRLERLQSEDGGVSLLPGGAGDPGATARVLFAAPDLLDLQQAQNYLQNILKDPAFTPDDRAIAYAGMAASGQPILLDLNFILKEQADTLSPAQKLYIGAGVARLGDFASAEAVYRSLSDVLKKEGNLCYMEGDGTLEGRVQLSAAALLLTSEIGHADADGFARYLIGQNNDRARVDGALYSLELLNYAARFSPKEKLGQAKLSYTLPDGTRKELTMPATGVETVALDARGLQAANFTVHSGKVYAAMEYSAYASEKNRKNSDLVKISKTYTPVDSDNIQVASRVKVELTVTFDPSAPAGFYDITDTIPSGLRFLQPSGWLEGVHSVTNSGQSVYSTIYREEKTPDGPGEPMPLEDGMVKPSPGGEYTGANQFTIVYYLSAMLPGDFITERVYLTPNGQDLYASSDRGRLVVAAREK